MKFNFLAVSEISFKIKFSKSIQDIRKLENFGKFLLIVSSWDIKKPYRTPLHRAADVGNLEIWQFTGKGNAKQNSKTAAQQQKSAYQGIMIRSLVPEDPTGETDCSTVILFQR